MKSKSKVLILAGGKGARLGKSDIAKPLRKVRDKACIENIIEQLIAQNLTDITISICHLSYQFMYLKDKYKNEANIDFVIEASPKGTAGIIPYILDNLDDDFLIINADLYTSFSFKAFYDLHCISGNDISLAVIGKPYWRSSKDCTIIQLNESKDVKGIFIKKENLAEPNCYVNAGIYAIKKEAIKDIIKNKGKVLDVDIDILLKSFVENKAMKAYETFADIIDIGTIFRLNLANSFEKLYKLENVVFLDRDGTINKNTGYITSQEQFEVIQGADKAIRNLLDNHYNLIVVTNQKQVGLNLLSSEDYCKINELIPYHDKLADIVSCFSTLEDNAWRKPNQGMLLYMAVKHNINLEKAIFFGDSLKDEMCAGKVKCKFARVMTNEPNSLLDKTNEFILHEKCKKIHEKKMNEIIDICVEKLNKGGIIYTAGNGGSHSDAEHITAELMKSFKIDRSLEELLDDKSKSMYIRNDKVDIGIKSICLTSNSSFLTAYANDKDYEHCLASQILTLCNENDIFVGLTTSGNSDNIANAIVAAKALNVTTILMTSEKAYWTFAYTNADYVLESLETKTDRVQNDHTKMYHEFCTILEERMYESLKKKVNEVIFK